MRLLALLTPPIPGFLLQVVRFADMAADSSETHILARFLTHLWPRLKQLEDASLYSGNATVMSALLDLYGKTLTSAGACQQHVCL